jgi:hypothetical protein
MIFSFIIISGLIFILVVVVVVGLALAKGEVQSGRRLLLHRDEIFMNEKGEQLWEGKIDEQLWTLVEMFFTPSVVTIGFEDKCSGRKYIR